MGSSSARVEPGRGDALVVVDVQNDFLPGGSLAKVTTESADAYSGFDRTELDRLLAAAGVRRLFVGGLATDYCVLNTVKDGLARATRCCSWKRPSARSTSPPAMARAVVEMTRLGAVPVRAADIME